MSPWWVTGIADGESCFVIQRTRKRATVAYTYTFRWVIGLRGDDENTLVLIQAVLGGTLYSKMHKLSSSPQSLLVVFKHDDLDGVVTHFDKFPLQSKKAADYVVWREAYVLWRCGGHRKPADVHTRVAQLYERLKLRRVYGGLVVEESHAGD